METIAFLGLMGLGYLFSPKSKEDFTNVSEGEDRTKFNKDFEAAGNVTLPTRVGKTAANDLDLQYQVPSKSDTVPREPRPDSVQGDSFQYATKAAIPQTPNQANAGPHVQRVQLRMDGKEAATPRKEFVSPLSGVSFQSGEFKHNNMVPFFRGQLKQNTYEGANRQILDDQTGSGSFHFAKREQTPFFEPTKTPTGNPYGMESTTDFMESRVNESRNRANERPMETIRVGPGLNQGYTQIPSGGFQQQEGEEYILARMPRTDDLRTANNPKLSYEKPVVPGAHFITTSGTAETVGEMRKYNPDTFYINENGERNFVTTGADLKAAVRSAQVLKNTTRKDTTREYAGPAGQAEGNATYTIASAKAPLVKQHGPFGWRNADASEYFNKDTDAEQNDYGRGGVEIRPNERFYTGERVHATNLAADKHETALHQQDDVRATRAQELVANSRVAGNFNAMGGGLPGKQTVYDPNDVARTTIKETTIDNDWLGTAGPGGAQPKLTVYDPNDVARVTIKETTIDNDWLGTAGPGGAQPKLTVYDPNDVARVTIKETTIDNDWLGTAGPGGAQPKMTVYDPNDVARTTIKETTIDNDWIGIAGADQAQKLTVYDPDDIARVTGRNTLSDWDLYRNMGRNDTPGVATTRIQDGVRLTQKAAISGKSAYTGAAGAFQSQQMNQSAAKAMRHYAQRENVAKGRAPTNSGTKLFNGEDYVKLQYRRIVADSINDRQPTFDRVTAETPGYEVLGVQRPRAALKLDISAQRNEPAVVSALEENPYVIPLHRVAAY
jgi:hypothetical protein